MPSLPIDATAFRERLQRQLEGAYVVGRELSAGGSSRVFLATDVALDRAVVLKVLPPELTADIDAERFRREIHFAARLQHPHLVPLLSAAPDTPDGDHEHVRWFSMPYIEGSTLRELLLRRGAPPVAEALRLLREIALGLGYAHARGIVHRDIKPENVLLNEGIAMISDFGVAKALDEASDDALRAGRRLTTVSTALGTPAYMAPEQVGRAAVVDHRADLYAFGCMAYELFTGSPPFNRASFRATLAAQLTETPTPLRELNPTVPQEVAAMVMRCLAKKPADRPHSATAIVRSIESINVQTDSTVRRELDLNERSDIDSMSSPSPRSSRRTMTLAAGVMIVALILIALFFTFRA